MIEAEKLVNILIDNNLTVTTAESCTGGMVSSSIVDIANASKVLNVSFVTYANDAKVKYLGVKEETISKYGVVSEEVTAQMALGAMKEAKADVSLVTSGVAGPGGGTKYHPVGMVCFGIGIKGKVYTYTMQFGDIGRNNVRIAATEFIVNKAIELLKNI